MNIKRVIVALCLLTIISMLVVAGVLGVLMNISFVGYEGELSAAEEIFTYNTNPLSTDTDNDGLNDYQEIKVYNSDPLDEHSDNDGIPDGQEVDIGADPTESDTDNDGLDDDREIELNTEVNDPDTDDDGLSDYEEVNKYKTSPTKANTDYDYLNDYEEIKEYNTNPVKPDTSGDGFKDGFLEEANEEYPALYKGELNPNKRHIFVYVSRTEGAPFLKGEIEYIEQLFENSPISYNGERGVEFHVIYNDKPITDDNSLSYEELENIHRNMDIDNMGFHHIVITDEIENEKDNVIGVTRPNKSLMLVKHQDERRYYTNEQVKYKTGTTALHELTHSLGLTNSDFEGIDTKKYSHEQYPSVMNYNYKENSNYNLSSNHRFDDWQYIEDNMLSPNTSKLEQEIQQD